MVRACLISSFAFIALFYISFPAKAVFAPIAWEVQNSSFPINAELQTSLFNEFRKWEGTKYEWGGRDKNGIDCSALTQKLYESVLHRKIPRTTGEQIKKGQSVSIGQLHPGDLLFFLTEKSIRHVGVFVGNGRFVHASRSKGVTISSLHTPFWMTHFETARRIATNSSAERTPSL